MEKKKRKKPGKCAMFICCPENSDSDEDFQEINDSLTTGGAIKKQPKETSPFQLLPGKETTLDIITKPHRSKENIKSSTHTPKQHGGTKSSTKPQINEGKKRIVSSSTEPSTGEMLHNVETLELGSQNSWKLRKKKDDISYDVGSMKNSVPFNAERYAKIERISTVLLNDNLNQQHYFATEDVVQKEAVSIKEIEEETESSSNVHKLRIKNLMDTFISTFTNGADRDEVIEEIVEKTAGSDHGDQDRFAEEHSVQVENISIGDEEENGTSSKGHNVMVTDVHEPSTSNLNGSDTIPIDESKPLGNDCNESEVKTTVSCKVKDEEYNNSEDRFTRTSDIKFAGGSITPEYNEENPVDVDGITSKIDKSVASWHHEVEDKSVEVEDKSVEVDPSASSSAECSRESLSPSLDALPDESQLDSSSDEPSLANKILKANTQRCAGPKEDPSVPKVPMPPNQPPTSDRRTIRRASKPRVLTEDKEETASTRERSSSPPARPSDLRGELLQSPKMEFSYESSDGESTESSHQESGAPKSEGLTQERNRSPPNMRPSDLSEEMIDSPGFKFNPTEIREEGLPVLPEPRTTSSTFEERLGPNLFGKNSILEEKLPNRLGSSALVLGAIGSQATPEKDPPARQYHLSPRRLDFTKHLMFSSAQGRPAESSSEESVQEKGLDDLLKPESKDNLINKKFSRLSPAVFPTSPAIKMNQMETKPAWSYYDKDFSSKTASTSGLRKEVRPKPAAAPRTRDLPPPQPTEFLLAPSLFGRRPGKDLPPVLGRGPSPGQALHPSSININSTSPTIHPSSKPFLSSTKPFNTSHKPNNPSPLPFHQESCSYPSHINSLESNAIADYEEELYPHTMPFHDHLRPPRLGFMPHEADLPPGHFIPTQNSIPNHGYPSGFNRLSFDDDLSPSPNFQKPMNMRFNNRGGLLRREKSRRH